ncbi:EAL domain-containing protein [Aromatoleum petrolei]|uniref:EAL domain-containing protein n=1 Tax=Aromatoleum petrolei TaxID=76116 RepID=A0ABX1MUD3_9RHOO|nr:EAL domain-containing protein [Aromatoleum petrolei]NMF91592.1 EAL domain-containing protein [Aromatoleum petrolei]QTQ37047.1 Putative two component system response regulator, CheY-like [Aromatoleum petrolei]
MDSARSIKNFRALVLDDDEVMREVAEDLLHRLGIEQVLTAEDGNAGLSLLQSADPEPNLLLCDLNMPGMDGIELLRTIAARGFMGDVVVLSGAGAPVLKAAERLAIEYGLGFLGVLAKPVSERQLAEVLQRSRRPTADRAPHDILDPLTPDEIRSGLDTGRLALVFQPKVSAKDYRVSGFECLARWRHPARGLLSPGAFIPVIEQHGLIDRFTHEVFRLAVAHQREWRVAGHTIRLNVNVSMDNLLRLDLPETLEGLVDSAGGSPRDIILELTETRLLQNRRDGLDVLLRMCLKGFGVSIDDFGTGTSTMERLQHLPITELKIDRAFVHGAAKDPTARAILESSATLGRTLGLGVVAEGVETEEDLATVRAAGCDEVQGYLVAKPMGAEEVLLWIERWEARRGEMTSTRHAPTLLVVDGDEIARAQLSSALGDHYRVRTAASGEEALVQVAQERPDLVLLDVRFPGGMDGYETCRRLTSTVGTTPVPVIFLSTCGAIEERLKGYDAGADDYLVKPVDPRELRAKLVRLLERTTGRSGMPRTPSDRFPPTTTASEPSPTASPTAHQQKP